MNRLSREPRFGAAYLKELRHQRRSPLVFLAVLVLLVLVPLFMRNDYYLHIMIVIFYNVIYASTYRFILRTGQFHFGAHAFIGIGAYASVLLMMRVGLGFWAALPLAGLIAAGFAVLIGYPSLRLKGIYFAIITWGFGDVLRFVYIRLKEPFGGPLGIYSIPSPDPVSLPWLGTVDFNQKWHYYLLALILMMLTLYVLYRLERSRFGLIFSAIREKDHLARSVGVNIMNYKVLAFAVCSGLAALGGSFYAHYTNFIAPSDFTVLLTIYLAIYTVVGGKESYYGAVLGTVVLMLAGEVFAGYAHYQLMMYSGFLILVLLFLPGGLASLPKLIASRRARLKAGREVAESHGPA